MIKIEKRQKKDISGKYETGKARVAILISKNIIKIQTIILSKRDITHGKMVISTYLTIVLKYIKQQLTELQEETAQQL